MKALNQSDLDRLDEITERWQQIMETLLPAFEAWQEAMLQFAEHLVETISPTLLAFTEYWTAIKREALYCRLRERRFPHWLARFLADRWPGRWLPEPEM